jgi:hypothetical protein
MMQALQPSFAAMQPSLRTQGDVNFLLSAMSTRQFGFMSTQTRYASRPSALF